MCKTSTTKQQTQLPDWANQASQIAASKAEELASKPFESYTAPRVADFSSDQSTAFQQLRDLIAGAPQLGPQVLGQITQASTAPKQTVGTERVVDQTGRLGAISDYMNPNVAATLAPTLRTIQEQADAQRKQLGASATMAGAFGDARHGVDEAMLGRNTNLAMSDAAAKAYSDAYNNAMNARSADLARFMQGDTTNAGLAEQALQRLMTGGLNLETAGTADQNKGLQLIASLLQTGGQQQGNTQAGLDAAYQEFLRKYGNDFNVVSALSGALRGLPMDTTTTATQPNNSGLAALGSLTGSMLSAPAGSAANTALMSLFAL